MRWVVGQALAYFDIFKPCGLQTSDVFSLADGTGYEGPVVGRSTEAMAGIKAMQYHVGLISSWRAGLRA